MTRTFVILRQRRARPKDLASLHVSQHPLARVPVRFAQDDSWSMARDRPHAAVC